MATSKVGFFKNAQPVSKAGSKKKVDNKFRQNTKGLTTLASIDAVMKALDTLKKSTAAEVKKQMAETFVSRGVAAKKRPENYIGLEGAATASLELRKRSEASPLDEYQAEALRDQGIALDETTTFSLNQEVLTAEVMTLVEKALNKVPGIPHNLFTVTTKTTVAEEALDQVFMKDAVTAKVLLDIVGVLAIKPKLDEDFAETVERVHGLLEVESKKDA